MNLHMGRAARRLHGGRVCPACSGDGPLRDTGKASAWATKRPREPCLRPGKSVRSRSRARRQLAVSLTAAPVGGFATVLRQASPGRRRRSHNLPMAPGSLAISGNLAEVFHRSRAPARSHGDRVLLLMNIPADKSGMCDAARPLSVRLGAGRLNPRSVAYRLTGLRPRGSTRSVRPFPHLERRTPTPMRAHSSIPSISPVFRNE